MRDDSGGLVVRDPAELTNDELVDYALRHGVKWTGFWAIPPMRFDQRRIWRHPYPVERAFMRRYFPPWFADQRVSIRNAIISKRSRNWVRNNIVMAPNKFNSQEFHGGLSPVLDVPTFGHELLHAMDRQLGGRMDILSSYVIRVLPNPKTGKVDEDAYYEFDANLSDPSEMFEQFQSLNVEAQAELFEEGIRRNEALLAASDEDRAKAESCVQSYTRVLEFVRSCTRRDRLRRGTR